MSGLAFTPLTTVATWGEDQVSLYLSPATIITSYRGASGLVSSLSTTRKSPSVSGNDHHELPRSFQLASGNGGVKALHFWIICKRIAVGCSQFRPESLKG
ncbi:hypothetical protein TIFTF001_056164, partial [Ficus carica]